MSGTRNCAVISPIQVIQIDAKICTVSTGRAVWGHRASTPSSVASGGRG